MLACEQGNEPLQEKSELTEQNKVILLDTTFNDLKQLPVDLGGEQKEISNDAGFNYYAYFPSGYEEGDLEFPLLLFLHGVGEISSGTNLPNNQLEKVLRHGPPKLIKEGNWSPTYPCLVISPQSEGEWTSDAIHNFIKHLIETYKVNPKRIYLTGLSMGGHGCWFYEGRKGNESYATAMVPICGRGPLLDGENMTNTPIWAFHGEDDAVVSAYASGGSFQMVRIINNSSPVHKAKLTLYPNLGHNSWERTYDGTGMGTENSDFDAFDQSIYDWMFQYKTQ